MFCNRCGSQAAESDKFCGNCGVAIKNHGEDERSKQNDGGQSRSLNINNQPSGSRRGLYKWQNATVWVVALLTKYKNSETRNTINSLLSSKLFWVIILIMTLVYVAYSMGKSSATPLTAEEKRQAISECQRWGGEVLYDSNGQYEDCFINSRQFVE